MIYIWLWKAIFIIKETLEPVIKSLIDKHKTNFKGVGQLKIALVGSRFGPGLYDVILSLDKTEVIKTKTNLMKDAVSSEQENLYLQ